MITLTQAGRLKSIQFEREKSMDVFPAHTQTAHMVMKTDLSSLESQGPECGDNSKTTNS